MSQHQRTRTVAFLLIVAAVAFGLRAQEHIPGKVEIPWNRYYDHPELTAWMVELAAAYPELCRLEKIGESLQGRPLTLAIVGDPRTGPDTAKPAMWIAGNVHGNEIQAAEAVLYTMWYLTKAHGRNPMLTELLGRVSFYLLPSENPDGRQYWFDFPNNPHSSRHNQRPYDNDRDGRIDEDAPDDLDGDGSITSMWQEDPDGRWRRDLDDPRVFARVEAHQTGGWNNLGSEGIDNDGDGDVNEDGPGGDDMNRSWPSDWLPAHLQGGSGPYPLSHPETRAIAEFILAHPNIAAGQSYHNTGGMILRGPGVAYLESSYPREDVDVYDRIARKGEDLLPYYRYMVIYKDLYVVHGGFVNWLAEGLGTISFTNELWTPGKYFQRDVQPDRAREALWRDQVDFGQSFKEFSEIEHPTYGKVLVGGPNRWSSRITPTFMLEEECHRNLAFTMLHAGEMPELAFERHQLERKDGDLWELTVQVGNLRLIPTRTKLAEQKRIGANDLLVVEPAGAVIAAGSVDSWHDTQMTPVTREPHRVQVPEGVAGHRHRRFRFLLRGAEGDEIRLLYQSQKAKQIETTIRLVE